MAIDVQAILNTITTGISNLAQSTLKGYLPQAEADGQNIVNAMKANVQTWTGQLTSGQISPDDLKFLISGNEELLKIDALTQAGIAAITLDQFKQGVVNIVVTALTSAIKI
ncbi:MAG TPA: hypothetical protein VK783_11005 [Bacteroidia bacterium]|jgi:hypothetical protein|nr:hypothetical protein [Bacteroidia bacterium]